MTDQIGLDVSEKVLKDVLRALPDQMWCERHFWSLSLGGALRSGWEGFVEKIKHETRYLFTLPAEPKAATTRRERVAPPIAEGAEMIFDPNARDLEFPSGDPDFGIEVDEEDGIPAYRMLEAIGRLLKRPELIRKLAIGTIVFRVRVAKKDFVLAEPRDFGPPARADAIQPNRMSPAGIVMFYGAMDRETALVETFQPDRRGASTKKVWVASFEAVRELRVLDLTNLPPIPSMFDPGGRDLIEGISFLHRFVRDLVEPINRDGREHIEYVPTQVVTEYIRHRFRTDDGEPLDGVLYLSSKRPRGVACVLFVEGENCGVPVESWSEPIQALRLIKENTEVLDGAAASTWFPHG